MEPSTLLNWLTSRYPLAKRNTFRRMLTDGRVLVNGEPVDRLHRVLTEADRIEVVDQRRVESTRPSYIVHEDADLIVANKPAGLLTSTGPREKRRTLLKMLREYLAVREPRARLGLIHRLDRDASGLLVFSKTDAAYRLLKSQLFHHTMIRQYVAVIQGKLTPAEGTIDSRLIERADGSVQSTKRHASGERAITHYSTLRFEAGVSLLRLTLQTGRKHQIRVHLSERGSPIVGDRMYGKDQKGDVGRLMLAAVKLGFQHPRSGIMTEFELPVPSDFTLQP